MFGCHSFLFLPVPFHAANEFSGGRLFELSAGLGLAVLLVFREVVGLEGLHVDSLWLFLLRSAGASFTFI